MARKAQRSLVGNAADAEQVRKAAVSEQLRRSDELHDIKTLLALGPGRRVLWKYLSACGIYKTSFSESHAAMSFAEGERNIGLKILGDIIEADPQALVDLMKQFHESGENR